MVHELDGEDEIFQMSDETESLFLSLQGRHEVMGDEHAQELECPIQGREEPVRMGNAEGLESLVRARKESTISDSV